MVSRGEFNELKNRVSLIESYLALKISKPSTSKEPPVTIIIEDKLFTENINEDMVIPPSLYDYVEKSDYHIFVRVYFHNNKDVRSRSWSKSGHGYYEFIYQRPYYSLLIIKKIPSFFELAEVEVKMNTEETKNIHNYLDIDKSAGLYFGYADTNKELPSDNLFKHGKENGVFFVLNDKIHKRVTKYISTNAKEMLILETNLAGGNIDIYKSKSLKRDIILKIIGEKETKEIKKAREIINKEPDPQDNF